MLCYLSSRDANEVIKDAFKWIVDNRRAAYLALVPMCLVCLIAFGLFGTGDFDFGRFLRNTDSSEILPKFTSYILCPTHIGTGFYPSLTLGIIWGAFAFVSSLTISGLLLRYFVDKRSINKITYKKLTESLRKHLKPVLLCATATALFFMLFAFMGFWFSLLLIIGFTYLQPCILMGRFYSLSLGRKWGTTLLSLFYIYLIFWVIKIFPFVCFALIYNFIYVVKSSLGMLIDNIEFFFYCLYTTLTFATMVAACISISVFQVCNLMLYGTLYHPSYKKIPRK